MVKVAIVHEGNAKKTNDNALLKLLIKHLKLNEEKVEFFGIGTKSNFFKNNLPLYMDLKLRIQEEAISKILFVVDADYEEYDKIYGSYEHCSFELESILKKLNLKEKSDFYITCNPKTKDGYLESLILSTIDEKERKCIEDFLQCSQFKSKENDKAILNQIYKNAYPSAPYNFEHPHYDELKQKLKNLFD